MAKRKYRSEIAQTVHEGVRGMHRLGLVDKRTMRDFDLRWLAAEIAFAAGSLAIAVWVFYRGLRRYESGNLMIMRA